MSQIQAIVFDLDGVLVDSEHVWDEVCEELAHERGGRWRKEPRDMIGVSSTFTVAEFAVESSLVKLDHFRAGHDLEELLGALELDERRRVKFVPSRKVCWLPARRRNTPVRAQERRPVPYPTNSFPSASQTRQPSPRTSKAGGLHGPLVVAFGVRVGPRQESRHAAASRSRA